MAGCLAFAEQVYQPSTTKSSECLKVATPGIREQAQWSDLSSHCEGWLAAGHGSLLAAGPGSRCGGILRAMGTWTRGLAR